MPVAGYSDDMNLLGDNIDNIKRNTQTLIDASKEAGWLTLKMQGAYSSKTVVNFY
jgi:hypothetical protein